MAVRPLTEEELELARRTHRGDAAARAEFISRMQPLAGGFARRRWRRGESNADLDDLIQAARLGTIEAIDKFDPGLGVPFTYFARQHMSGRMREAERAARTHVHIPAHVHQAVENQAMGRPYRNVSDSCMAKARESLARRTMSLAPRSPEMRAIEPAAPEEPAHLLDLRDTIERYLKVLSPRDRGIIRRRYGLGGRTAETFERIGLDLGISESAARKSLWRLQGRIAGRHKPKRKPRYPKRSRARKAAMA